MDATRPRAVSYLLTGKAPQWRPFGHIGCENALSDALRQPTSETCSSAQFRASRFIALSPRTIRITRGYKSSADKRYAIVKWLRANVDFAFRAAFPAARAVSLPISIIPQEQGKVYYFLQDFIFFHKILLLSAPHRFTVFSSDWARSSPVREEMRLIVGKRECTDKRDTPQASLAPCRSYPCKTKKPFLSE